MRKNCRMVPSGISLLLRKNDPGLLEEQDRRLLMDVFPGFWFDFPTPFQKGDILWNPNRQGGHFGGPFVCISINHHGLADKKRFEYLRSEADTTDMQVNGLFANGKYGVYEDCMSDYFSSHSTVKLPGKQSKNNRNP